MLAPEDRQMVVLVPITATHRVTAVIGAGTPTPLGLLIDDTLTAYTLPRGYTFYALAIEVNDISPGGGPMVNDQDVSIIAGDATDPDRSTLWRQPVGVNIGKLFYIDPWTVQFTWQPRIQNPDGLVDTQIGAEREFANAPLRLYGWVEP